MSELLLQEENSNFKKVTLTKIEEIQRLTVKAGKTIPLHTHPSHIWEAWIIPSRKEVFVCMKGEEHFFQNATKKDELALAIKGSEDYTLQDFKDFFEGFGYTVVRGSVIKFL